MKPDKQSAVSSSQLAEEVALFSLPTANCNLPTVPLIIGHRGAAAVAPENTLVSFRRAIIDGADGIEFDVRLASDGVPVVIHDPTLRRTARRPGRIADMTSAELHKIDVGTWFNRRYPKRGRPEFIGETIPTLADVFDVFDKTDVCLYVELKCGARDRGPLAKAVANLMAAYSITDRVVVESFDLLAISEIRRIDPCIRTAALFDRKLSRPAPSARSMLERALRVGANEIALHHSLASGRVVHAAARQNLKTIVWTADSQVWVERAITRGIGAIITNNPARLCVRRSEILGAR